MKTSVPATSGQSLAATQLVGSEANCELVFSAILSNMKTEHPSAAADVETPIGEIILMQRDSKDVKCSYKEAI